MIVWMTAAALAQQPAAVVDAVLARDARGGLHAVASTPEARLLRAGQPVPLFAGAALLDGDVLVTGDAEVRLRLHGDEQVIVGAHAEVEIGPRSWLQRVGEALYRVHGVFRVRYAAVEAAVDGTRFVVAPDRVDVLGGDVHVTDPANDLSVTGGHGVSIVDGLIASPVGALTSPALDRALQRHLGPPRFAVQLDVGGGAFGGGGAFTGRLGGRWMVGRTVELFADVGITADGKLFHIPVDVGLAARFGWLRLGIGPQLRIGELCDAQCNKAVRAVAGGVVLGGVTVPLGGRLNFEATIRGGWAVKPHVDAAVGFSVGL